MLEVKDAYERALSARERHITAQDGRAAAAEAERITEERFRKGVVKMIDLLDTTTALREAETRELVARSDAHLASFRLAAKSGRAPETVLAQSTAAAPGSEGSSGFSQSSNQP